MERLPLFRVTSAHGDAPNASIVPVFSSYVLSRITHTYRADRGDLPQSTEDVELRQEGVHPWRDREPDVRRRSTIHGPDRVHKHDLVGAPADSSSPVLFVGHTGPGGAVRPGGHDRPDPRERSDREQNKNAANQTNEEQRRESEVDERGT